MSQLKDASTDAINREILRRSREEINAIATAADAPDGVKARATKARERLDSLLATPGELLDAHPKPKAGAFDVGAAALVRGSENSGNPNLKGIAGRFSTKRYSAVHAKTGAPVRSAWVPGGEVEGNSEFDEWCIGTIAKMAARKSGAGLSVRWSEADQHVLDYLVNERPWHGWSGKSVEHVGLRGMELKALLDDTTSGGSYLVPDHFDARLISAPLLTGELLPYVDTIDVDRASTVTSQEIGDVTLTWGTSEGTGFSAFTTTGLLTQASHGIYPVVIGIELGLDLLADENSGKLGAILSQKVAERLRAELDKVIAVGNGTTQPTGLTQASGTNSLSATNGTSGPFTVGDMEQLMFGLGKQYRVPAEGCAYVTTDELYRRARAVPVGTSDARRVFGMDHASYRLFDYPVRISNDITEGTIMFTALKRYRLYRRLGFQLKWSDAGSTLMLKNCALMVMRARFGGFLTLGEACAIMTNGPTTG